VESVEGQQVTGRPPTAQPDDKTAWQWSTRRRCWCRTPNRGRSFK